MGSNPLTTSQHESFQQKNELVEYVVRTPLDLRQGRPCADIFGEEVLPALPGRLEKKRPGLPADGVAGAFEA